MRWKKSLPFACSPSGLKKNNRRLRKSEYHSFSPAQAQSSASKLDEIQVVRERLLKLTTRFSDCIKESCVVNREVNETLRLRVIALCLGSLKLTTQSGKFMRRFTVHRTFYNMDLTKLGDRAEISLNNKFGSLEGP